jgi:voltage-gated potassium channel
MNKQSSIFIYELFLASLVIFSLIYDDEYQAALDLFVWGLFVVDYIIRLWISENKWTFIKSNPLDLIAIIPLDQFFKAARIVRLFRVIRLIAIFNRRKSLIDDFFRNYNIDKLLVFIIAVMFITAIPMKWIEDSFETYGDAFWWVIVTTTTVGYGDLYPETIIGRIIASFLMIVGVGILGIITGSVASFLTRRGNNEELPEELTYIRAKIDQYPNLENDDYQLMIEHLKKLSK